MIIDYAWAISRVEAVQMVCMTGSAKFLQTGKPFFRRIPQRAKSSDNTGRGRIISLLSL